MELVVNHGSGSWTVNLCKRNILCNSGTIVQSAMVTLGPFMNKGFKDSIHRLTGTPLELHELFIKRYGFTGLEIESIMRRLIKEYC